MGHPLLKKAPRACLALACALLLCPFGFGVAHASQVVSSPIGYLDYALPEDPAILPWQPVDTYTVTWQPLLDIASYQIGLFAAVDEGEGRATYIPAQGELWIGANQEEMPLWMPDGITLPGTVHQADIGVLINALAARDANPPVLGYYLFIALAPEGEKHITQVIPLPLSTSPNVPILAYPKEGELSLSAATQKAAALLSLPESELWGHLFEDVQQGITRRYYAFRSLPGNADMDTILRLRLDALDGRVLEREAALLDETIALHEKAHGPYIGWPLGLRRLVGIGDRDRIRQTYELSTPTPEDLSEEAAIQKALEAALEWGNLPKAPEDLILGREFAVPKAGEPGRREWVVTFYDPEPEPGVFPICYQVILPAQEEGEVYLDMLMAPEGNG